MEATMVEEEALEYASLLDIKEEALEKDASLLDVKEEVLKDDASLLDVKEEVLEDDTSLLDMKVETLQDDASLLDVKEEPSEDNERSPAAVTAVKEELDIGPTVLERVDMQDILLPCKHEPGDSTSGIPDSNSYTAPRVQLEAGAGRKQQPDRLYYKLSTSQVAPEVRKLEIPRKCNICKKMFAIKANYYSHIETHIAEPTSSRYDLSGQSAAVQRMESQPTMHLVHLSEPELLQCRSTHTSEADTKRSIRVRSQLKAHSVQNLSVSKRTTRQNTRAHCVSTGTGRRSHCCDVCGKNFDRKSNLTKHSRIHTGQKPYNCDICGKSFTEKSSLTKHNRIHTGQKPFSCNVCGKSFNRKDYLTFHLTFHSRQKSFSCDICGKSFTTKSRLNTHLKIHTGQKPHSCNVCGKSFQSKRTLSTHLLIHK